MPNPVLLNLTRMMQSGDKLKFKCSQNVKSLQPIISSHQATFKSVFPTTFELKINMCGDNNVAGKEMVVICHFLSQSYN